MRRSLFMAIIIAAILSFTLRAAPALEGSVVVINLEEVFENSAMVSHRSAQLRSLGEEVQAELEAMTEEMENLQTELQIRPESHPRFGEYKERFEVAKLRRELYRERQSQRLQRREMELLQQSYEDMRTLIAAFAKQKGLAMVLLNSDSELQAPSVQALRIQLAQRAVLYHDADLNVTDAFIEFANSRFRGGEEGEEEKESAETDVEENP